MGRTRRGRTRNSDRSDCPNLRCVGSMIDATSGLLVSVISTVSGWKFAMKRKGEIQKPPAAPPLTLGKTFTAATKSHQAGQITRFVARL